MDMVDWAEIDDFAQDLDDLDKLLRMHEHGDLGSRFKDIILRIAREGLYDEDEEIIPPGKSKAKP
jgi:hypothetical protein